MLNHVGEPIDIQYWSSIFECQTICCAFKGDFKSYFFAIILTENGAKNRLPALQRGPRAVIADGDENERMKDNVWARI